VRPRLGAFNFHTQTRNVTESVKNRTLRSSLRASDIPIMMNKYIINILCGFPIMMNKDTRCDDSVVTCSNIVVITAYNVYVYFFS